MSTRSGTPNESAHQLQASYDMNLSINLAQRAFNELLKTCLGHHSLTVPVWSVLGSLYKQGPMRPTMLASSLGIKPPYISVLVSELELDKLIELQIIPDDERGKLIAITVAGRELVEHVESQLQGCLQDQFGQVKYADLQVFFTVSKYIADHVKHHS